MRLHKCRVCLVRFEKVRSIQPTCGNFDCQVTYANKVAAKAKARRVQEAKRADAKLTKERKEANKKRSEWIEEAQRAFNAWVRARDADKPCICCGKPFQPQKPGGSMDAGHYLSRGSSPHLRFDERNVHGQRKNCNRPGGAKRLEFRAGMIKRIGLEELEALECDQTPGDWTIDDLKNIIATYKAKLKELKDRA